jgi:hypothetical protein
MGTVIVRRTEPLKEQRQRLGPAPGPIGEPLPEDPKLVALWAGVEQFTLARFLATEQFVTPYRDPEFDEAAYEAFLLVCDYGPVTQAAYGKLVQGH